MRIGALDHSAQLQFITFKILTYKISEYKQYKKNSYQFREKITAEI